MPVPTEGLATLNDADMQEIAIDEAQARTAEGGIPIEAALFHEGDFVARDRN